MTEEPEDQKQERLKMEARAAYLQAQADAQRNASLMSMGASTLPTLFWAGVIGLLLFSFSK